VAVKIAGGCDQFALPGHQQLLKHAVTKRALGAMMPIRCCQGVAAQ
jgi:hypothetical protein